MDRSQHEVSRIEEPTVSCAMENLNSLSDCVISSKLEDTLHLTENGGNDSHEETEPMSFVVLGKDSLDAIQASSLASYVDIQQKSMLVDYNSMISSLATSEIHQKLADFLKENTELKETLRQNSLAMKKQFIVLTTWHNKLTNLQETHNKKFKETTSLINNLKRENLELKTRLAMQQTQDLECNFEAIDTVSNLDSHNTSTHKEIPQVEASTIYVSSIHEEEKYVLPNDLKPNLTVQQSDTKHNSEEIDTVSSFGSNNTNSYEVVTQIEASASCAPAEKKHALPDKQHVSQCSCKNLNKEADCYANMCNFQKLDDNYTKQKIMEQKSLLGNDERQISCEYVASNENSFVKFEESSPAIDRINKLIYSIDKCDMDPAYWNDGEYENNRIRYNNMMCELVKNFMEVINRCRVLTYCLRNIVTIFAPVEKAIDEGTFGSNLELLKKRFAEYRTEASIYNRLIRPDNDMNYLTLTFCDALKNVQDHVYTVFMDYRETLHMVYLMMDESLKMTNAHDDENSQDNPQEQTEVRKKLRILAIQHDKMQKEKEEFEKQKRELDTLSNSVEDEKKRVQEVFMLRDQLIRRRNLYDGKLRALLDEKRLLIRDQKMDVTDLLEKFKQKNMECVKLQHQLDQNTSEIGLYKNQLTVYEEDFKQEKKVKELLLEEKSKLDEELGKQVNYNKKLLDRLSSSNIHAPELASQYTSKEIMPPCPKCERAFATVQSLTEHIEQCLKLNLS